MHLPLNPARKRNVSCNEVEQLLCDLSVSDVQVLKLVDKDEQGRVQERDLMSVRYVPLTEPGTDPYVGKDEE